MFKFNSDLQKNYSVRKSDNYAFLNDPQYNNIVKGVLAKNRKVKNDQIKMVDTLQYEKLLRQLKEEAKSNVIESTGTNDVFETAKARLGYRMTNLARTLRTISDVSDLDKVDSVYNTEFARKMKDMSDTYAQIKNINEMQKHVFRIVPENISVKIPTINRYQAIANSLGSANNMKQEETTNYPDDFQTIELDNI